MLDGTGLAPVAAEFPDRVFDVGICEQHAVTLAAGLATQGFVPIVAIYSTFLQRAYDQIIHDVCLQDLPVVFAIDRAGIVGDDGKTHQGAFDISYLRGIPNMVVAAPQDEDEFQHLLYTAVNAGRPMAVRFPRGSGQGVPIAANLRLLPIGKGELHREGRRPGDNSHRRDGLSGSGRSHPAGRGGHSHAPWPTPASPSPSTPELIKELAAATGRLVTVEENTLPGGFGSAVLRAGLGQRTARTSGSSASGLPDQFIEHGSQAGLRSVVGLDPAGIARAIKAAFPELLARTKS